MIIRINKSRVHKSAKKSVSAVDVSEVEESIGDLLLRQFVQPDKYWTGQFNIQGVEITVERDAEQTLDRAFIKHEFESHRATTINLGAIYLISHD